MLQNYSKGVRRILTNAHLAASKYRHRHIHTEYLLLGLLEERNSATGILKHLGCDRESLRRSCEGRCEKGHHIKTDKVMDSIQRMTPRVQQVMAIAGEEMEQLGHEEVDTRHVLLGILLEDNGAAGDVLREAGVTADAVRDLIRKQTEGNFHDESGAGSMRHEKSRRSRSATAGRGPLWKLFSRA